LNGKAIETQQDWDPANARLAVTGIKLTPTDKLDLELSVNEKTLLDERDQRTEKIRKMLRTFRLESDFKNRIDQFLPQLLTDSNQLGAVANYLKNSQIAALANALEK